MKLAGHTMGTPGLTLSEAMRLFREIGFDGIEIRCAENGQINPEKINEQQIREIMEEKESLGLDVACLTPYYRDFVSPKKRDREIEGFKRVIQIASKLNCERVRVYGGVWPYPYVSRKKVWLMTIKAVRELCTYAGEHGVYICIENHPGTLTETATQTVMFIEQVNSDFLKILYDQANIDSAQGEKFQEAISLQKKYIFHVHVKDQTFINGKREPRLLGKGEMNWKAIIDALKNIGYREYLSDEYEKYWHPQLLPEPAIGMEKNLNYLKEILYRN